MFACLLATPVMVACLLATPVMVACLLATPVMVVCTLCMVPSWHSSCYHGNMLKRTKVGNLLNCIPEQSI